MQAWQSAAEQVQAVRFAKNPPWHVVAVVVKVVEGACVLVVEAGTAAVVVTPGNWVRAAVG